MEAVRTCSCSKIIDYCFSEVEATSQGPCAESGHTNDCPWSPLYRPVCGSDNNTYANVEALLCQANKTQEGC